MSTALALNGTPLLRMYPGLMCVVTTFKVPPSLRVSGGGGGEAMLASANPGVFGSCAEIFDV